MKVLKKSVIAARGEIEHTKTEKSVLARLDHPFLAKLHFSFQTPVRLSSSSSVEPARAHRVAE